MRCASPSTTAVLPTPGSPMSTGLFLVRRDSTCTTRRISASRPMTGSILPSRAAAVRSTPYFSSAWKVPSGSARGDPRRAADRLRARRPAPRGGAVLRAARRRPRRRARPARAAGARWRRTRPTGSRASRSAAPRTASEAARRLRARRRSSPRAAAAVDQPRDVGPHAPAGRRRPPAAAAGSASRRRRAARRRGGPARRPGCRARRRPRRRRSPPAGCGWSCPCVQFTPFGVVVSRALGASIRVNDAEVESVSAQLDGG